ncbi:MAG: SOS response-associated peptidase [Terriglobales bacterium]
MCGRFTLRKDSDALAAHFEVEDVHPIPSRYNIAPTQAIPVIRVNLATGRRELAMMRWGLSPPWAEPGAMRLINARAETLAAKPAFRDALRRRRCLIPADGFYEWQKLEKSKQPWFIHRKDDRLFAFAGLWERGNGAQDEPAEACTIITTVPIPALARLHDRMPAIPSPEDYPLWLDPKVNDPAAVSRLLAPPAAETADALEMYPVRKTVNWADKDSPECIEAL